jgi:hypothetical protein
VSFTLFARANLVMMASLLACALSFAGAILLVLELDNPFTGLDGDFKRDAPERAFAADFVGLRHTPARGRFYCQRTPSAMRPR